jgi:prepilin-type N-terminal cleavage/methylation domain-containing protein
MIIRSGTSQRTNGFTLAEVVMSMAIGGLLFAGVLKGYVMITDHAEWSSYSLAAQSLAMQGVEQARSAKWDPNAYPSIDQLGVTNYQVVEQLDVPIAGTPVLATNYISISTVMTAPPLRQLTTYCVWMLPSRGITTRGPFTNTVNTLRGADQ